MEHASDAGSKRASEGPGTTGECRATCSREPTSAHIQSTTSSSYAACGPPATGALQAIKNAGIAPGKIIVVGFDASADEVKAILAGEQAASVAQFPAKMGSLGIETAVKAAKGETVEKNVDTGTKMVTKANADKFK